MVIVSLIFFSMALCAGLYLLSFFLRAKSVPASIVRWHGLFAATGLFCLIYYVYHHPNAFPFLSLIILLIAASGGLFMRFRDKAGKFIPIWFPIGHGLIAFIGVVSLISYVFLR